MAAQIIAERSRELCDRDELQLGTQFDFPGDNVDAVFPAPHSQAYGTASHGDGVCSGIFAIFTASSTSSRPVP